MAKKLPPIHPGEILREEFLVPLRLTPYAVAAALHVPRTRIERIAREEKPVTADTALRLGKFFKTGAAISKRPKTCSRRRLRRLRPTRRREGGANRATGYVVTYSSIIRRDVQSLV